MTDPLDLDRLRDALDGRLSPADRDALARRRAAEPELDAVARDLEAVTRAESGARDEMPACSVTFDAILPSLVDEPATATRRPRRSTWAPFVAAAAAVLVLLGGVLSRPASSGPVALRAVALEAVVAPPPLPAEALDYEPAGPKGLRFVNGFAAGRSLSEAAERPLVVFVHHPTCPVCQALRRGAFKDPTLAAVAKDAVLAQADVTKNGDGGPLLRGFQDGWPVFLVYEPGGRRVDRFSGSEGSEMRPKDAKSLAASLGTALETAKAASRRTPAGDEEPAASWDSIHTVARALADADAAIDPAERWRRLADAEAAAKDAKDAALVERVRATRAATTDAARLALSAAKALADAGHVAEAERALDKAAAGYRGTPVEDDLRRVRERLVSDGRFPALETSR